MHTMAERQAMAAVGIRRGLVGRGVKWCSVPWHNFAWGGVVRLTSECGS